MFRLSVKPTINATAIIEESTPPRSGSTLPSIEVVLGDANNPEPTLTSAS